MSHDKQARLTTSEETIYKALWYVPALNNICDRVLRLPMCADTNIEDDVVVVIVALKKVTQTKPLPRFDGGYLRRTYNWQPTKPRLFW